MMKDKKRYLYLDCEEARLVLQSLIRFKNKLQQQGRYQGGGKSYCCGSKGNHRGNQSTGCRDCCRWVDCCGSH